MNYFGRIVQQAPQHQLFWLMLSGSVLVLDQATKFLAATHLISGVNLTLLHNTGAAFSLLANESGWQNILFVLIAVAVGCFIVQQLVKVKGEPKLLSLGLSLVLGGALGNTWDRLSHQYVIDFIDLHFRFYHWPAFNVADAAICIGAFLWCFASWRQSQQLRSS